MKRLEEYDVYGVPIGDIYFDGDFNCRGSFTPQSVSDLADSIKENGLQFPIVVQPHSGTGHKYRLLAGHRRFRAVTIFLEWTMIPATIRFDLTPHQARILNLTENLERKDLNMLEEAKALRNLYPEEETSLRAMAKELKRPTRWVHARLRLLDLPEEVQKWAAAGIISALNIEAIHSLETAEEQLRACTAIVQAKQRGKTKALRLDKRWRRKFRPRRTKAEIVDMIGHLFAVKCDGLSTRLLAWVAGRISDEEIEEDIQNAPGYRHATGHKTPYHD